MKRPAVLIALLIIAIRLIAQSEIEKNIVPLKLEDGKIPITQLQPMINEMGVNRIVGLGEGTHGTKEFNELRISLIKELIEKKSFRIICFENTFGDCYYFNELINSTEPIEEGMKKYMLSLWQTKELEELFEWIREYNQSHSEKVSIAGMDFNYLANTAKIIASESKRLNLKQLISLSNDLYIEALSYDSVWNNQMKGINRSDLVGRIKSAKSKLQQIDSILRTNDLQVSDLLQTALLNGRSWGSEEGDRDKNMALMAVRIGENNKMIIWAHAVHLALRSPFKDNTVGGCGGYIKQRVPDYYSLGTGTAIGKYGGFEDRFDTRINAMKIFELPSIKKPSWENYFIKKKVPAFFIDLRHSKDETTSLPLRLVGYGPPKGISYSDDVKLSELFDAYIFIEKTNAPEYLP